MSEYTSNWPSILTAATALPVTGVGKGWYCSSARAARASRCTVEISKTFFIEVFKIPRSSHWHRVSGRELASPAERNSNNSCLHRGRYRLEVRREDSQTSRTHKYRT